MASLGATIAGFGNWERGNCTKGSVLLGKTCDSYILQERATDATRHVDVVMVTECPMSEPSYV